MPHIDNAALAEVPALAITRLMLTDFRSYGRARLDLDARPVVLTGPNGAGKTNLLEAVSFLVPGRGLRRAKLGSVARRGSDGTAENPWAVAAEIATAAGGVSIGTGPDPEQGETARERRIVRIDGAPARSQAALGDIVALVWLTPQMDRLFLDGASERRRFMDRLAEALNPEHGSHVNAYDHAMRERLKLLRGESVSPERDWLDALEARMAEEGVAIAATRRLLAQRLDALVRETLAPFPAAAVMVEGLLESGLDTMPALAVEDRFRALLAENRRGDADAGMTQEGPHRSDMTVLHLGSGETARSMPAADCSTGEQKALLIALVLAHARLVAATRNITPLVLLDEIAAHLDRERRQALFELLLGLGAQAWLTGTDAEIFASLGNRAQLFAVAPGRVLGHGPITGPNGL
ncbi:MAG: DNA replication/repair protein RecF [Dongiaceae bacterium]